VVATARKLLIICWHLVHDQVDYAFARPSLNAKKTRALQLKAGAPSQRGPKPGPAAGYSLKTVRDREKAIAEAAETAYRFAIQRWQPRRPSGPGNQRAPKGSLTHSPLKQ
jgi:hypothetical protein